MLLAGNAGGKRKLSPLFVLRVSGRVSFVVMRSRSLVNIRLHVRVSVLLQTVEGLHFVCEVARTEVGVAKGHVD